MGQRISDTTVSWRGLCKLVVSSNGADLKKEVCHGSLATNARDTRFINSATNRSPADGHSGPAADGLLPGAFRGQPAVNVWEQRDALRVEMELPGVKNEQLEIAVAGGELSIKVNRPDVARKASPIIGASGPSAVQPPGAAAGRGRHQPRRGRTSRRRPDDHAAQGRVAPRKINVTGA